MSVSDPIADMICVIKNGYKAKKEFIEFPFSRIKFDLVKLLQQEGYITQADKLEKDKPVIKVELKYGNNGESVITDIKRISKPGRREYYKKKDIQKVKNGFGISIISTSKGVMTGKMARINNVGGEILCTVW